MPDAIDLVVPNVADFNLRHPRLALDPATQASFAAAGAARADQCVFWSTRNRVLILPQGVDAQWLSDVHLALGCDVPPVVSPATHSGLLVPDLLLDPVAMAALRHHLAEFPAIRLASWGATEGLYRLIAVLRSDGHEVITDVPEPEHYWSSLYLESKQSCVDLASQIPGLRVVPPLTVDTWQELSGAVGATLRRAPSVIVRSRYGVGGEGSAVLHAGASWREELSRCVREDPLLRTFPLIVQEYLAHQPGFGCPAADLLITDDAHAPDGVAELVTSTITVDSHRVVSVNVGQGLVPAALEEELHALARQVAVAARRLGFRGWFSVDFIADASGSLILTEFNARRVGGMAGIAMLGRWRGTPNVVAFSRDVVPAGAGQEISYQNVRPVLAGLRAEGVPAFATTVRALGGRRPSYGILAGGSSAAQAQERGNRLRKLIDEHLARSKPR